MQTNLPPSWVRTPPVRSTNPQPRTARPQPAQPVRARQSSAQNKPAWDWFRPVIFILLANILILFAMFLILTLVLSPAGIALGWQAGKIGWKGLKELLGR